MKRIILLSLILISFFSLQAEKFTPYRGTLKDGYDFWLVEPADTTGPKPLFVFLHGASLCGRNLERVKTYGTLDAISKGRNIDGYVIAPQNPGGAWNPRKIQSVIDWAKDNNNIDADRIYVLGMSLGGYGVIDFVATYPDEVAAAIACCGGGSVRDLSMLNNVPLWIIHGTADRAVHISQSDQVVKAMKKHDSSTPRLIYDRVPGWSHGDPARLFYLNETYEWLLNHSLSDEDRPVTEGFGITQELMRQAYKGLNTTRTKVKNSFKKKSTTKSTSTKKQSRKKTKR